MKIIYKDLDIEGLISFKYKDVIIINVDPENEKARGNYNENKGI